MKKEDILERNRQFSEDEGMKYAEDQGRKIGFLIFYFVAIAIVLISASTLPREIHQLVGNPVLILAATFGIIDNYVKYRFSKQIKYAIWLAIFAVMLVVAVYRFASAIMGL